MYEPILMSKASFERLTPEQQQALLDAGQKAEDYFFEAAKGLDEELVETFEKAGVEVAAMSQDQFDAWLDLAKELLLQDLRRGGAGRRPADREGARGRVSAGAHLSLPRRAMAEPDRAREADRAGSAAAARSIGSSAPWRGSRGSAASSPSGCCSPRCW